MQMFFRILAIFLIFVFAYGAAGVTARLDWPNVHAGRAIASSLLAAVPIVFLVMVASGKVFRDAPFAGALAALLMCSATLWLAYDLYRTAVECPSSSMGARGTNWCKPTQTNG